MRSDLPDSRTLLRWLPVPSALEAGETVMRWQLEIASRYREDGSFTSPVELNYRGASVQMVWVSEQSCVLSCRSSAKTNRKDLYDSGYRAVLAIDRYVGRVVAINGVDRSGWWFIVLGHYVHPDGPQAFDKTELMKAAQSNDVVRLNELLAAGVEVNATDMIGTNALCWAAQSGAHAAFERLLEYGADPKSITFDGRTLLHFAAYGGDVEIVSHLVSLELEVNVASQSGNTPLGLAVIRKSSDAALALLRLGANPAAERGFDICSEARSSFGANHPVTAKIC